MVPEAARRTFLPWSKPRGLCDQRDGARSSPPGDIGAVGAGASCRRPPPVIGGKKRAIVRLGRRQAAPECRLAAAAPPSDLDGWWDGAALSALRRHPGADRAAVTAPPYCPAISGLEIVRLGDIRSSNGAAPAAALPSPGPVVKGMERRCSPPATSRRRCSGRHGPAYRPAINRLDGQSSALATSGVPKSGARHHPGRPDPAVRGMERCCPPRRHPGADAAAVMAPPTARPSAGWRSSASAISGGPTERGRYGPAFPRGGGQRDGAALSALRRHPGADAAAPATATPTEPGISGLGGRSSDSATLGGAGARCCPLLDAAISGMGGVIVRLPRHLRH
jgi:hypothetical protein